MRKCLFIGLGCLLLVSCRKAWTCDCTTVTTASAEYGGGKTTGSSFYNIAKDTKKEADKICKGLESNRYYNEGVIESVKKTCEVNPK